MPTARFSIMSIRPIPYPPASAFSLRDQVGERQLVAVERDGHPGLEADDHLDRRRRAAGIGRQRIRLLRAEPPTDPRARPASIARPKRFSSIEYGAACVAWTGIPLSSA